MPCSSDYMRQNDYEKRLQETAQLLVFAMKKLDLKPTPVMVKTAGDYYARTDFTADLCKLLKSLTEFEADRIIYNGRDPVSRRLADWWERHQQADRARLGELDAAVAAIENAASYHSIRQGLQVAIKLKGVDAARAVISQSCPGVKRLADVVAVDYPHLAQNLLILLRAIRVEETA